MQEFDLWSD